MSLGFKLENAALSTLRSSLIDRGPRGRSVCWSGRLVARRTESPQSQRANAISQQIKYTSLPRFRLPSQSPVVPVSASSVCIQSLWCTNVCLAEGALACACASSALRAVRVLFGMPCAAPAAPAAVAAINIPTGDFFRVTPQQPTAHNIILLARCFSSSIIRALFHLW